MLQQETKQPGSDAVGDAHFLPIALVTGGSQRVGRVICLALAGLGYRVAIHYAHSMKAAHKTRDLILSQGGQADVLQADLTDIAGIRALLQAVDQLNGRLEILINCAALMISKDLLTLTEQDWSETMDLNLRTPFFCSQRASLRMGDGGLIVNISDYFADQTWKKYPLYGLSKSSLEHLTRMLANRLEAHIRVNALALAPVIPPEGTTPEEWSRLIARSPGGQAVPDEQIGRALAYLVENEYISGEVVQVTALGFERKPKRALNG